MSKLNPRGVFFDYGSTLVEYPSTTWEEVLAECVEQTRLWLVKQGHIAPDQAAFYGKFQAIRGMLRETAERTLVEWSVPQVASRLLDDLKIDHDEDFVNRMFEAYYEPIEKYLYVCEGAVEVLTKIREKYDVIGLISNTIFPPSAHLVEMERFGLSSFFDFKIFSSEFGLRKPHPAIFVEAANRAGLAPAECVYIGDRYLEDVKGPIGVGMSAILKFHPDREYPDDMSYSVRRIECLSELDRHFDF